MICDILLLGEPALYEVSAPVEPGEDVAELIENLHDTLMEYRRVHGAGRAIAAPQIGVKKRLIYLYMDKPYVLINPSLSFPDKETYRLLDDCMSFPGLVVEVERYRRGELTYFDMEWKPRKLHLEGDWSELVQHEYDHLDGILATMRAVDSRAFYMKELRRFG